jgi:hypothetical protein
MRPMSRPLKKVFHGNFMMRTRHTASRRLGAFTRPHPLLITQDASRVLELHMPLQCLCS